MSDIVTIKRMLSDRAQDVAEMLLPNSRRQGSEWTAGSIDGEAGKSLSVHLRGTKAGVWQDFATGDGGDLIDLWCGVKGLSLVQALDATRHYLDIQREKAYLEPIRQYSKPSAPKGQKPQAVVMDYLREGRNVPVEILEKYRIGENGNQIIFPFFKQNGDLALVKSRTAEDGAKPKPTSANCEPILFGWQAIPNNVREIVITEGEIDALSLAAYGYNALSVPFGGGKGSKQRWIENEYENLERFEKIYIATDMDQVGNEAAQEIAFTPWSSSLLSCRASRKRRQ